MANPAVMWDKWQEKKGILYETTKPFEQRKISFPIKRNYSKNGTRLPNKTFVF